MHGTRVLAERVNSVSTSSSGRADDPRHLYSTKSLLGRAVRSAGRQITRHGARHGGGAATLDAVDVM